MSFKITLLLAVLLSLAQFWHNSKLASIFSKPVLRGIEYQAFSHEFRAFVLLAGLLLLSLTFLTPQKPDTTIKRSSANWIISFVGVLSIVAALVAFVNPEGRFPWNERKLYISIEARRIKTYLYERLNSTPELIVFGSSISFAAPASYFKDEWGLDAFNMSLNGGGPADFIYLLNYLIQKNPDAKAPSTLLVEILSPRPRSGGSNQMPLKIIPYVPRSQASLIFTQAVDSLISASVVSDSIFTLFFVDTNRWEVWATFSDDGTAVRTHEIVPPAAYQSRVKELIPLMKALIICKKLDTEGLMYIQKLVDLSHEHQFSIVFYRTPINFDFYALSNTKPGQYAQCKQKFDAYMKTLTKQNSNIFFSDLSDDKEISTLGNKIYSDTHHLNREGHVLVWQALEEEIESALQWAKTNRSKDK